MQPRAINATDTVRAPAAELRAPMALANRRLFNELSFELWLILIYLVVTIIGDLKAGKLGIQLKPVPLFLTDITLILVMVASFVRWPTRLLVWFSEGVGAGPVGRGAWLLCVLGAVYFALAANHIDAARDLAIFGYSLFFPLTYFALRDRRDAATVLRCLVYSGVILALLVLAQFAIGGVRGHMALVEGVDPGHNFGGAIGGHPGLNGAILGLTNEDDAAFSVFALAALSAYILCDTSRRWLHVLCATVCFFAMATATSRATMVGLALAFIATLVCAGHGRRRRLVGLAALLALPVILQPVLPRGTPGRDLLRGLRVTAFSALGGPSVDSNEEFRLVRWRYAAEMWLEHPVLGAGFGLPIVPSGLIDERESRGSYNVGMPHNTFLYLAARAGVLGLGIVLFCWSSVLRWLFSAYRRTGRSEDLAALNILVAMFGFGMFVLFFERPITNAAFWIMMAVGTRLSLDNEGINGAQRT